MATNIRMQNMHTKEVKESVIGFSWTTLLFGAFVPLLRGDLKWFIIFIVLSVLTFGLAWFAVPFLYNKIYVKDLISKGYIPMDDITKNELRQRGIYFNENNS